MREDDREHRIDDETTHRPEDAGSAVPAAPVIRLLANPRRTRRA